MPALLGAAGLAAAAVIAGGMFASSAGSQLPATRAVLGSADAARCAGDQGRFWEYHDLLYRSQAGENQGAFAKDRLKAFGGQLGLEPAAFGTCVDGDSYADAVQRDFADVRDRGFNSTPTFLIGNRRIVGAQPFEIFQAAIEAQRGGG